MLTGKEAHRLAADVLRSRLTFHRLPEPIFLWGDRPDPSVLIGGVPAYSAAFRAGEIGPYDTRIWYNLNGIIRGGTGLLAGSNIGEAANWLVQDALSYRQRVGTMPGQAEAAAMYATRNTPRRRRRALPVNEVAERIFR